MGPRHLMALAVVAAVTAVSGCGSSSGTTTTKDLHLDYAYYNPLSLVIRDQQLLAKKGYHVTWVLSQGSNKANEGLRSKALDFGSTGGSPHCWRGPTAPRSRPSTSTTGASGPRWLSPRTRPLTQWPT